MADQAPAPMLDGETPVNPYSLLEAVNHSSDTAHTAWLIFLSIMAYLMIAVAGVTHRDLLLETPVLLPVLQVKIQLTQFFQFATVVLVLIHLGLVSQLVLLAKETLEFDNSVKMLETSSQRTHPLRLELNNFFFVQAIAGPQRSMVMSGFLHGMSWLTLVVLPVVLLLYVQVVFLPYHNIGITWTHRLALLVDIAMLIAIGIFLMQAETSFVKAFLRTTTANPLSFGATTLVLFLVALFSFFVATIPGEALDRATQAVLGTRPGDTLGRRYEGGFSIPGLTSSADGSLFGIFRRNIVVTDTDLVTDKDQTPGEPSLTLRGRDLRYAQLDRSDLHYADLTGANIDKASFSGTDLTGAWLQCADINELLKTDDRRKARCTSARGADFSRAKLDAARMSGIDLTSAKLEDAHLEAADLSYAQITGSDFSSAHLDKADMTGGIGAQGVQFLIASLQGTDLTGAQLQGADFSSANMQGALLNYAHMQGAILKDAVLDAASFHQAHLEGASFKGSAVTGADFSGAYIWMTTPPADDGGAVTNYADLVLKTPEDVTVSGLTLVSKSIVSPRTRTAVTNAMAPLMDVAKRQSWLGGDDYKRWFGASAAPAVIVAPDQAKVQLSDYLAKLMCRPRWSSGGIATGIARRAQTPQFRGDLTTIFQSLKDPECSASKTVLPRALQDLSSAADAARIGG
jgi:uncharacterized protein YjbI with pentapeptide repeats